MKRCLCFLGVVLIGLLGCTSDPAADLERVKALEVVRIDLASVQDGVYKGSYSFDGTFRIEASVSVEVKEHVITDIKLLDHKNWRGESAEVLPALVKDEQRNDVDGIAGATFSSKVILKAIENALQKGQL